MMRTPRFEMPSVGVMWVLTGTLLLAGCDPDNAKEPAQSSQQGQASTEQPQAWPGAPAFVARFVALRQQAAERLNQDTGALCASIDELIESPDDSALQKAQSSWNYAHGAYLGWQTLDSGFRDRKQALRQSQQLDAWPIMAGYIDYTTDHPRSGIVYDTTLELDLDTLLEQHQLTDPSEVSVGFHALEFLLWGEADGSRRSAADFSLEGATEIDAEIIRRRQAYLGTLCKALEHAATQVTARGLPEKILSSEIIDSLAGVIEDLVLEQRIVSQTKAHVPDPECGFSETPMCGIPPIAKALRLIFLDASQPQANDTIVGWTLEKPEKFGVQLQPATENALGALESLSDPLQRDDLFAAEALTRTWLAEVRSLQRAIVRPGGNSVEQP